jgi:hypothetical protein
MGVIGCQTYTKSGTIRSATAPAENAQSDLSGASEARLASQSDPVPLVHESRPLPGADSVTKADVIDWTQRGLAEEVIIDRIERSGSTFHLNAADVNDLRDHGVNPSVIALMRRQVP